ncbi:MAG: hypothetical protein IPK13_19260 [Deltaproteobacteria bacterium]|nr:hypothetical protein [Deltaproteobacteria bacterium]
MLPTALPAALGLTAGLTVGLTIGLTAVATATPADARGLTPLALTDFETTPRNLWQGPRTAAVLAQKLRYLGWPTMDLSGPAHARRISSFLSQNAGVIRGEVRAPKKDDIDGTITVALRVERASAPPLFLTRSGLLKELDGLVAELAVDLTRSLGRDVPAETTKLLRPLSQPTTAHRFLGLGALRLYDGDFAQARVMFSRARSVRGSHALPEVVEGRRHVEASLASAASSSGRRTPPPRSETDQDLASAALERARVALRTRDPRGAAAAFETYFMYTDDRAQRWALVLPMAEDATFVLRSHRRFVIVRDELREPPLVVDAKYGTDTSLPRPVPGLVAISRGQYITLHDRTLARLDARLTPRWSRALPSLSLGDRSQPVVVTSGVLGVLERQRVTWLDLGLGTLGQVAVDVSPIASGMLGVMVKAVPNRAPKSAGTPSSRPASEEASPSAPDIVPETTILSLLRPGKRTPAWSTPVSRPRAVRMTREKVVTLGPDGLTVLDALDGKPRGAPIPTPADAHFLGGEARFVVLGFGDRQVAIYDVLRSPPIETARIEGPSIAVSAVANASTVAVLFESGDLIWFSADGRLVDRALLPGAARGLFPGSPLSPGVVAWTTLGLFAFSDVAREPDRMRDVDGLLALARALADEGDVEGALIYATETAAASRGRIADAEALRAELYERIQEQRPEAKTAAVAARLRAKQAEDPTRPLGPFKLCASVDDSVGLGDDTVGVGDR